MNTTMALLSTVTLVGNLSVEAPNSAARRVEYLISSAIIANSEHEQRAFAFASETQFSRCCSTMSSDHRIRIAFLSSLLIETADSWDTRLAICSLFTWGLIDRDGLRGYTAIFSLIRSAEEFDNKVDAGSTVGLPKVAVLSRIEAVVQRFANILPPPPSQRQKKR